ncbi:MAG: rod-binding protein [Spirochaetaceae bacterium]|jgi:flagellar protein FlgJ|nr:rod-binding protein [Spirochaetaceae bacterium]
MELTSVGTLNLEESRFDTARLERLRNAAEHSENESGFAALLRAQTEDKKSETSPQIDTKSKLYEQCEALEMFFLKSMINGMRKTVEKSELTKTGFAGEMYEDMLWDEYSKNFSRDAGFGFARLAYLELTGQRGKIINQPV